jgi:hypothetical protein
MIGEPQLVINQHLELCIDTRGGVPPRSRAASPAGHVLVNYVCFFKMGKGVEYRYAATCTMYRTDIHGACTASGEVCFNTVQYSKVVTQ